MTRTRPLAAVRIIIGKARSLAHVTAEGGRIAAAIGAVTRRALTENTAVFLALRANNDGNLQCQHNDAFSNTPNYPWRLRFSRAPCQAPLAYAQRILAALTRDKTMLTVEHSPAGA